MTADVIQQLEALGDKTIAEHSQRFFKTGKGEYGEGDVFIGIRVPVLRQQVKLQQAKLSIDDCLELVKHRYHEVRLFALLVLVAKFKQASLKSRYDDATRKIIYQQYLQHTDYINNWDLVDSSAHLIVGPYLEGKSHSVLQKMAAAGDLWQRRIAMMSCYHFIKQQQFTTPLKIATILLHDRHDLIHKVVGWMLREIGKSDLQVQLSFMNEHYREMPRTMLRYAIEKLDEPLRQDYLQGNV